MSDDYQLDFPALQAIADRDHPMDEDERTAHEALPHLLKWGRNMAGLLTAESARLAETEKARCAAKAIYLSYSNAHRTIAEDIEMIDSALDAAGFLAGARQARMQAMVDEFYRLKGAPPELAEATSHLCEVASDLIGWLGAPARKLQNTDPARRLSRAMMGAAVAIDRAHLLVAPEHLTITEAKNRITALEWWFRRIADCFEEDTDAAANEDAKQAFDDARLRVEAELSNLEIKHPTTTKRY